MGEKNKLETFAREMGLRSERVGSDPDEVAGKESTSKPSGLPDSNFIFFVATKKTK